MPTYAQLKALRGSRHAPAATTEEFKEEIVAALASAGAPTTMDAAKTDGPHTVLALLKDHGLSIRLWAIPDANLDDADRARISAVAGRCFATHFTADLNPEQFSGALVVLVRTGELALAGAGDGLYDEIAAEFEAEGVAMPDCDWARIAGDVWGGRDVSGDLGRIELTHFYPIHLAM